MDRLPGDTCQSTTQPLKLSNERWAPGSWSYLFIHQLQGPAGQHPLKPGHTCLSNTPPSLVPPRLLPGLQGKGIEKHLVSWKRPINEKDCRNELAQVLLPSHACIPFSAISYFPHQVSRSSVCLFLLCLSPPPKTLTAWQSPILHNGVNGFVYQIQLQLDPHITCKSVLWLSQASIELNPFLSCTQWLHKQSSGTSWSNSWQE